jgi:hypothetical protein
MPPRYPTLWGVFFDLVAAVLFRQRRSFGEDARASVALLEPPLQIIGKEYIPSTGPCLVTTNHYQRPGFPTWWLALGISAAMPCEVLWVFAERWTYPDWLRSSLYTPVTRWAFHQAAQVYGFTTMPPMPPQPDEVAARARAVRRVLAYARQAEHPVIGLTPEGRDVEGDGLGWPPPGAGRFMLHLAATGLELLPVGVYEDGEALCVRFGPCYRLEAPQAKSPDERDRYASQLVMEKIALQVPAQLRGEFHTG